jgi:hypothetical protein
MKIRQGFVSNSSSASYIVTINKTFLSLEAFLGDIYDSCWCAIQECENDYFDTMEAYERAHPTDPEPTTIIKSPLFDYLPQRTPRVRRHTNIEGHLRDYFENFNEKVDATRYTLSEEGITVQEVGPGKYSLSYFTSMHNSFNNMSSLLKCIYFEYLTQNGGADLNLKVITNVSKR